MLDVKVKSIDAVVLERAREDTVERWVLRSEGVPQEIRKPDGHVVVDDGKVGRVTADGEHDSLPHRLADRNIFPDLMAALEKFRARVDGAIALVAKVGARPLPHGSREDIDEADVDDVHGSLLAEMPQARLVGALALGRQSA